MIAIAPDARPKRGTLPQRELRAFVAEACAAIPLRGDVSVLLTTDNEVQALNRTFRRKNKPTDVLSFPAPPEFVASGELAGDLAVSIETAGRQADAFGHSLLLEVKILLLHGLLHLAGFDHETDEGQMARKEQTLRRRFSLPLGLIQRAVVPAAAKTAPRKTAPTKAILRRSAATGKAVSSRQGVAR